MQDKLYKILGRIITLPVVLVIFTGINIFHMVNDCYGECIRFLGII